MNYKKIYYAQEELREFERAISLMTDAIREKNRNEKPLIFHSLRVGMELYELKLIKEVVIAGFLHDLIEDTNYPIDYIEKKFGKKVFDIVTACTADNSVKDYKERWHKFIKQIIKGGKEAMILKVVDAHQNLPYVTLIENKKKLEETLWKHNLVINKLKEHIGEYIAFKQYEKELRNVERWVMDHRKKFTDKRI